MNIQSIITRDLSDFSFSPLRFCRGDVGRIVQAGTSVANTAMTNIANAAMNNKTNKINKQIADESNLMNLQIHESDNNFNAEQAQIQREWDSASAQRQRLVEAGYNPLMLGDGGFSSSGSSASAASSPSLNSATMNPNTFDFRPAEIAEAIGHAIGRREDEAGARKTEAEAEGQEIANKSALFNFEKMPERFMNEQEAHDWAAQEHERKMLLYYTNAELNKSETALNLAKKVSEDRYAEIARVRIEQENENLAFLKEIHPKQLIEIDEQIASIRAQKASYYAQAEASIASAAQSRSAAAVLDAQKEQIDIDNQTRAEANQLEIQKAALDIETGKILATSYIQSMDMSEDEKYEFAHFLASHPKVSATDLANCAAEITSHSQKEMIRKYGSEVVKFVSAVGVGTVVGFATANPVLGVMAGAGVMGAPVGGVISNQSRPSATPVRGFAP